MTFIINCGSKPKLESKLKVKDLNNVVVGDGKIPPSERERRLKKWTSTKRDNNRNVSKKHGNKENHKMKESQKENINNKDDLDKKSSSKRSSQNISKPVIIEKEKNQKIKEKKLVKKIFYNEIEELPVSNHIKKDNQNEENPNNPEEPATASEDDKEQLQNNLPKEVEHKVESNAKEDLQNQGNNLQEEEEIFVEPYNKEIQNNNCSGTLKISPPPLNQIDVSLFPLQQKTPSKKSTLQLDKEKLQKALKLKNPKNFLNKTQNSKSEKINIEMDGSKEAKLDVHMLDIVDE
ncbi:Hypothetical protein SRAE_2000200900 [Strongyloides ratti]|uniref:Uncharacterized protein n=1 Tax=Strongyloides ratti TaxID=34506 RepID=A0A090LIM7_STRRB|nr:Hypothetical protein SRAE_2000200900 [Strongyloides ratti]CEF67345.1 Hypothetical protein SRAE_2000200900 [Strongyloides ratti]